MQTARAEGRSDGLKNSEPVRNRCTTNCSPSTALRFGTPSSKQSHISKPFCKTPHWRVVVGTGLASKRFPVPLPHCFLGIIELRPSPAQFWPPDLDAELRGKSRLACQAGRSQGEADARCNTKVNPEIQKRTNERAGRDSDDRVRSSNRQSITSPYRKWSSSDAVLASIRAGPLAPNGPWWFDVYRIQDHLPLRSTAGAYNPSPVWNEICQNTVKTQVQVKARQNFSFERFFDSVSTFIGIAFNCGAGVSAVVFASLPTIGIPRR